MSDNFLPKTDIYFILEKLKASTKVITDSIEKVGDYTYSFVIEGDKPLYKRQGIINFNSDEEVNFDQATAMAIKYGFMGELLKWYESEKSWKEGAYIVK
ncbi:hypothetical protein HZP64_14550 [Elizabethkingia anophelis]|nr:hypothetical protein [Elizabethkingia anophelis]